MRNLVTITFSDGTSFSGVVAGVDALIAAEAAVAACARDDVSGVDVRPTGKPDGASVRGCGPAVPPSDHSSVIATFQNGRRLRLAVDRPQGKAIPRSRWLLAPWDDCGPVVALEVRPTTQAKHCASALISAAP